MYMHVVYLQCIGDLNCNVHACWQQFGGLVLLHYVTLFVIEEICTSWR